MPSDSADLSTRRAGWVWPVTLVVIVALTLTVVAYLGRTFLQAPQRLAESGAASLREVASAFRSGNVTVSFVSYASELAGVQRLQVVELRQNELFEHRDTSTALWGAVDLPEVIVRARAPVEYNYYLDLEGDWELVQEGDRIRVYAPRLQHTMPAVDTSNLRYEVATRSVLRNEEVALARLKEAITFMSQQRARENRDLVRELARRKTAEFVDTWLRSRFDDAGHYRIEVTFRDEMHQVETIEGPSPINELH